MYFFIGWFATLSAEAFSPDSVWKKVERKSLVAYDEEVTFYDKKKRFATQRTFDKAGVLLTETNFKDYKLGIKQGFARSFYKDGGLYWVADYRNNELWGEFRVYYEDGALKRRETYWSGVRKEKHCYNRQGDEITFYEFAEGPLFKGGDYVLQNYLRSKLKDVQVGSQAQVLSFDILVQADSSVSLYWFNRSEVVGVDKVSEIIKDMPKWIPAHFDETPHEQVYKITLIFRAGTVYLSQLALDFAGAYRKKIQPLSIPSRPIPFPTRR